MTPIKPAVQPVTVSQSTCLEVLGIDERRYLSHLRLHKEIPRRRVGRLVVTAVTDWIPGGVRSTSSTSAPSVPWSADAAIRKAVGS